MNFYFMVAIAIANILSIIVLYQFIKSLENKQKLIIIASSIAITYMFTSIIYWISGFGINKTVYEGVKNYIIYLFVPINMILFAPYLSYQYVKLKDKKIKKIDFIKKAIIVTFLFVVVLIIECPYLHYIQKNIENSPKISIDNEIEENIIANEELLENKID